MILPLITDLTDEQLALIEKNSTHVVLPDGSKFYFMPYWFEEREDGDGYMMHRLGHLPEKLIEFIGEFRGEIST